MLNLTLNYENVDFAAKTALLLMMLTFQHPVWKIG
jgi:hypothetical protein